MQKIEATTAIFVDEAKSLKDLLKGATEEVLRFKKIKDQYQDEAEFLGEDRDSDKNFRYKESIEELL